MFRVIVQDSHLTPTSGKVVAQIGHYDPHTKAVTVDTEKAAFYLSNGAQPSDRVARLLQKEGVKLPDWVTLSDERSRTIRNAEKLRKNQPKEEATEEVQETEVSEEPSVEAEAEAPAEENITEPAAETPSEEPAAE